MLFGRNPKGATRRGPVEICDFDCSNNLIEETEFANRKYKLASNNNDERTDQYENQVGARVDQS